LIVTASDLEKRVPLNQYPANLQMLLWSVPAHKTIYSDFPIEPGREAYQAAFQQAGHKYGIRRANFARIFNGEGRQLDIFSWLLPHLNSRGHYYWLLAFKPEVDMLWSR
jgi:hypothetical protein